MTGLTGGQRAALTRLFMPWGRAIGATGLLVCGCDEEAAPLPPVSALVDIVCDRRPQCGCAEELSDETCRENAETLFARYVSLPTGASITYDSVCGDEVVAAYEALGCGADTELTFDLSRGAVAECGRCKLYVGWKQAGEPCKRVDVTAYDDCAQGLFCLIQGGDPSDEGTCVDPCETAGAGEPCRSKQCGEGLVCTGDPEPSCQSMDGVGAPCGSTTCAEGLVCGTLSGTCMPTPQVGEPCEGPCASGSYCALEEAGAYRCRVKKPAGEACFVSDECESHECDTQADVCVSLEPLVCSQRF